MRKFLPAILLALLSALSAYGQNSTLVTINATDTQGTAWFNGTYSIDFVGPAVVTWPGGTVTRSYSGNLNTLGSVTLSLPSNATITPTPTFWSVTVCPFPNITTSTNFCATQQITVSGTTQTVNFTPPPPQIPGSFTPPVAAYADAEITAPVIVGFIYYQVQTATTGSPRVCQVINASSACTAWAPVGSGTPTGFPRLDQVLDQNTSKAFNQGNAPLSFSNGAFSLGGETAPLTLPVIANCTTSVNGQICFDSTNLNFHLYNGADSLLPLFSPSFVSGDVAGLSLSAGKWSVMDLGPLGGSSGSTVVQAQLTNIVEGDSLCWDAGASIFVNCTPGVPPIVISASTYAYDGTGSASPERGDILFFTNAGGAALSFPQPSAGGVINANWFTFIKADGGTLTLTVGGTGIFNDNGTNSITVAKGTGCSIFTDPTGVGTMYTKCAMVPLTAGSGVTITPAAYSIAIAATGSGGTITGSGTSGTVPVWTGTASLGNGAILDDTTHAARDNNGFDVNSLGDLQYWILNNASPGTTLNKMVCDDGTGKGVICSHTTSTTNDPLGVAVAANGATPGTTGSTGVCNIGFCTVVMDNSATANHYAQQSASVDGDLSDVGATFPTNGQNTWHVVVGNSGAGTTAIFRNMTASELNASSGGGGKSTTVQVNGTATKTIANFNGTTPSADANNQLLTYKTSSSGNTSSVSVEVPLATTGQAGIVQLAGALGGTSSAPTLVTKFTISVSDLAPVAGDDGLILVIDPAQAIHLTRFACGVQGTTSVVTNMVKGGNSLISDQTCTAGSVETVTTSTFANGSSQCGGTSSCAIAAHAPVTMHIGTISGTPTSLQVAVEYTVD